MWLGSFSSGEEAIYDVIDLSNRTFVNFLYQLLFTVSLDAGRQSALRAEYELLGLEHKHLA